jgi:hypothetical protein
VTDGSTPTKSAVGESLSGYLLAKGKGVLVFFPRRVLFGAALFAGPGGVWFRFPARGRTTLLRGRPVRVYRGVATSFEIQDETTPDNTAVLIMRGNLACPECLKQCAR